MISRRRRPIENERSEQIYKIYKISLVEDEQEKYKIIVLDCHWKKYFEK